MTDTSLPKRVIVKEVLSGRYKPGTKPMSWDARHPGTDKILTAEDESIELASTGGQSTPAVGWELLLMEQSKGVGLIWTLYGIPRAAKDS